MISRASGRLLCAVAVLLGAASSLDARQSRPQNPPWWKTESIVKDLQLTPKQVEKIDRIFNETVPELREHNRTLAEHEAALSRLIKENASEVKVGVQIGLVESARARHVTVRQTMLYRMRNIITPDQRTKFDVLHAEWLRNSERLRAEQNRDGKGGAKAEPRPDTRGR